jgi:hypothetical protein
MIEGQSKAAIDTGLDGVLRVAEGPDVLVSLDGAELGGRTVFIGGADKENLVADLPSEACMNIGRKKRADEIAEVLYAVHVWQCASNENL